MSVSSFGSVVFLVSSFCFLEKEVETPAFVSKNAYNLYL
jgi:hypothetical protein